MADKMVDWVLDPEKKGHTYTIDDTVAYKKVKELLEK
jgi:hypothetical protein